jgi:hypothetical protein
VNSTRLTRALADGPARSPDDLCDNVLARLAPRPRDDIALLHARTVAPAAARCLAADTTRSLLW